VLTPGRRLLLVSPCGERWWSSEPSTTRRSAVDRRTATMMYAYRNRSKAIRRWLPLNRGARAIVTRSDGGRNAGEDQICCGGAPARRGGLDRTRRRSRAERREDHGVRPRSPSQPRGTWRVRGRWRRPRPSARSCGQRVGGTAGTDGSAPPTSGRRSRAVHLVGVL